jgi:RNA polymerase sigma-70 factor, ECF subfamily
MSPMATDGAFDPELIQPVVRRSSPSQDVGLEEFVVEHYERLLRLARLVCHDVGDSTDAVQAGLERAWRHRADLRDVDRRGPWLDRIIVREAIRVSKRRRTWLERVLGLDHHFDEGPPDPDSGSTVELRAVLDEAFEGLSADQRAVVALHLHAGYTVQETASIVGVPVETVRSRLRLARQRLRSHLEEVLP